MSWATEIVLGHELGGRASSDLREENHLQHLIVEILQHRLDHLNGEWRWPQPDPDLRYEGEVVQWEWQHAPCSGLKVAYAYEYPPTKPCGNVVRLTQEEAARHVMGEEVEVYCSWCAYDRQKAAARG